MWRSAYRIVTVRCWSSFRGNILKSESAEYGEQPIGESEDEGEDGLRCAPHCGRDSNAPEYYGLVAVSLFASNVQSSGETCYAISLASVILGALPSLA